MAFDVPLSQLPILRREVEFTHATGQLALLPHGEGFSLFDYVLVPLTEAVKAEHDPTFGESVGVWVGKDVCSGPVKRAKVFRPEFLQLVGCIFGYQNPTTLG